MNARAHTMTDNVINAISCSSVIICVTWTSNCHRNSTDHSAVLYTVYRKLNSPVPWVTLSFVKTKVWNQSFGFKPNLNSEVWFQTKRS